MSTPIIRRTTARLAFTGAMALGSAGLLVGPAVAQAPYPPPEIDVQVVTPNARITITGSGWDRGATVEIRRRGPARDTSEVVTTAEVNDDGTFEAPVTVPEDAAGTEVQYVISGVDEQGNEREDTRTLNVQLTSADMAADDDADLAAPVPATEDDGGAGLALLAGGAAALAGGAAVARRKVRQGS